MDEACEPFKKYGEQQHLKLAIDVQWMAVAWSIILKAGEKNGGFILILKQTKVSELRDAAVSITPVFAFV